ncbi:unnamed protein product [Leptidea sinapis]|uniref:Uncharacterized protein n=1 Tax=Leptidea sinapis TaxID=189913 RepID=A0A5E4PPN7_9NEOP|nr:unnamed protein product [Leptidea sinapis]
MEAILQKYSGDGDFEIPSELSLQRSMIVDQLTVMVEKKLYTPISDEREIKNETSNENANIANDEDTTVATSSKETVQTKIDAKQQTGDKCYVASARREKSPKMEAVRVVPPKGQMSEKHDRSAPFHIFYTTITDARETHSQPYSITLHEILDRSLGELQCSLQINFMVDASWLLAHYYFAGYSGKKLTILYGDDALDLRDINQKKPNQDDDTLLRGRLPEGSFPHYVQAWPAAVPGALPPTPPDLLHGASQALRLLAHQWGLTRAGSLLRQHCCLWLTGDFLHHFTKIKDHPQAERACVSRRAARRRPMESQTHAPRQGHAAH